MAERRIAVVGGGMAALSAAFELTRPGSGNKVTIYQLGWRLGGKCASGNDEHGRNVEHGLHVWFGYYENTFRLLREVYEEWQPPKGQKITSLRQAVREQLLTPIGDGNEDKPGWYRIEFPVNSMRPGFGEVRLDAWDSLTALLRLFAFFFGRSLDEDMDLARRQPDVAFHPALVDILGQRAIDGIRASAVSEATTLIGYLRAVSQAAEMIDGRRPWEEEERLYGIADSLGHLSNKLRASDFFDLPNGKLLTDLLEIVEAFFRGFVTDMLLGQQPIAKLDQFDFRHWLMRHGASYEAVDCSPALRALYDTMFQYPEGDFSRPSYGAGTAAQVTLRMIGTYAGALAWQLAAGTGQVAIAPLYEVLKQRDVQFRFFHKLTDIGVAADADVVETLTFDVQVAFADPAHAYQPVDLAEGLMSWRAEPDWCVIRDGDKLRGIDLESHWCQHKVDCLTLKRGHDFDDVILAIPLGAFKKLNADSGPCRQLFRRSVRFRTMADCLPLVPSLAVQVWSGSSSSQLGWYGRPAVVSGPRPLGIWSDMTHMLEYQRRASSRAQPRSLHYFCDVFQSSLYRRRRSETDTPARAERAAIDAAIGWFENYAGSIWQGAGEPGRFDWSLLFANGRLSGSARLESQVVHANVDPSGCCVSSAAGTTAWRLKTDQSGFAHLYLAGSWIDTGLNTECIEAAVMSGRQAARAICGDDREVPGENFLHPDRQELSLCDLLGAGASWLIGGRGA